MIRMTRSFGLAALAAMALAPAASAQGTIRRVPPPESGVRVTINGREIAVPTSTLVLHRRARLGVTVDLKANPNDSVGATISAVTPGGPAFKAGIQSGDIVIRLDGHQVTDGPRPANAEPDQSLPGLRLVEIASRLAPEVTVSVEYKRGTQRRTVSLVTGNEPIALGDLLDGERRLLFANLDTLWIGADSIRLEFGRDSTRRMLLEQFPRGQLGVGRFGFPDAPGGTFEFRTVTRFTDLELAPINPELGSYFGATEGVLVVRAGERSNLGLKGGDVLLTIDGRRATTPAATLRILRSYDAGDTLRLEILRNRQRQTLHATISARE